MMKKKFLTVLLAFVSVLCLCLGLVACGGNGLPDEPEGEVWTIERVYATAKELGFEGTIEDLIAEFKGEDGQDGKDGKDGVGIKRIYINENDELVIELTEGDDVNLGIVRGKDGKDGQDGKDGVTPHIGENGHWWLGEVDTGIKAQGADGQNGQDLAKCEHVFPGEWSVQVAASCTSIGYSTRTCEECGFVDYQFHEATGHDWEDCESFTVVEPTCVNKGIRHEICNTCGTPRTTVLDMLEHEYRNRYCIHCGQKQPQEDQPPAPPVPEITRRADPRAADAYEAYDYTGEKIGEYKTIADAINAVVEADLPYVEHSNVEYGAKCGYVLKKGETRHIFDHTKGFAEGNADCFWYYEDGNKLEAYDCWNATEMMSLFWNRKTVSYGTVSMGSQSAQHYNGFGLLDGRGELIPEDTDGTQPQIYMFSKPMDAGIMAFPGEKSGASGLRYTLDLSKIKITPAYDGVTDKIYAYFGFYIWQPYYIIATGLACDTTTGHWYPFRGTSRDNSFYDIVYNVDESTTPVFTSTWNEAGYFVPDAKTVDFEIKTVRVGERPEEGHRVCFEDHLDIVVNKGLEDEKTEKMIIDDALLRRLVACDVGADNTFVFIAGLDIKNHEEGESVVPNVDYFNGAKFEGLTVTAASVYFPTVEELEGGTDFNDPKDEAFRGNWYDALMANDDFTEGTWDFTFLYNYLCTSYEKKDGADVYNFRFDGSPVADTLLGGKLKGYQDIIDSLRNMTEQNFEEYVGIYDEVTKWYGLDETHKNSTLLQQYYLVLDFSAYTEYAKGVYEEVTSKISEAGQKILDELETMGVLAEYDYKGWEAPEGAESNAGYLWSEAQQFGALLAKFNALSEIDKKNIFRRYKGGEQAFRDWQDTYEGIKAYLDNTTFTSKSYTLGNIEMDAKKGMVTYTGAQALEKIFELAIKIHTTAYKGVPEGEEGTLDSDDTGCFQDGFHLLFLLKKMEEAEVTIPDIFTDIFYAQITSTDRSKAFVADFNDYIYPVLTLAGEIYAKQQNNEFVWLDADMAKIINDHMIGFKFSEAGFIWNTTNNADLRDGNTFYEMYFGLPDALCNFRENLQYIFDVVSEYDPDAKLAANGYSYENAVVPPDVPPTESGSADAKAVVISIGSGEFGIRGGLSGLKIPDSDYYRHYDETINAPTPWVKKEA